MARNIPRSSSANDVGRRVFAPRWGRSGMPTTTQWRRASSPRSNASCSIAIASRRRPKRALLSSSSSRVSTIRADDTHRSGICHPSSSSANLQMRPSNPGHTSMLSCSRRSRSGLETSQQASPSACRPSLTAARHDSLGNVQAGTKRCSRPNQKITQKRRTECSQIRYPDPKTSPLHETGASPKWGTIMLMRRAAFALRAAITALIVAVSVTGPVAGPLEDAEAAMRRGNYEAAMRVSRPLAEKGDTRFQYLLGAMYQHGLGTPQDFESAVSWFRKAADQGHAPSQFELGRMYAFGRGVPQDETEGAHWFRKAADQGHADAQAVLGAMYVTGSGIPQDNTAAASWFQKSANQGNAHAQSMLGDLYYKGQGVAQDYAAAMSWYRKAADQGNADAQHGLASLYYKGNGVAQDYAAAMSWYQKAANQGNANSPVVLGAMYFLGQGVPKDSVTAYKWLSVAAARGAKNAEDMRNTVAAKMTSTQIAKAQRLTREWKPKLER